MSYAFRFALLASALVMVYARSARADAAQSPPTSSSAPTAAPQPLPEVKHFQLGIFNGAPRMEGPQLGFINGAGEIDGVQLGLWNLASNLAGLQLGLGCFQIASEMYGLQLGIGVNGTKLLRGVQLSLFNVAGDAAGLQLGAVNYTESMSGLQLGIANISEQPQFALGLVNWAIKGRTEVDIWTDTGGAFVGGVRNGGEYHHYLYSIGTLYQRSRIALGMGLGGRAPFSWGSIELDVMAFGLVVPGKGKTEEADTDEDTRDEENKGGALLRAGISVSYALTKTYRLALGVHANALCGYDSRYALIGPSSLQDVAGTDVRVYPSVGLSFRTLVSPDDVGS